MGASEFHQLQSITDGIPRLADFGIALPVPNDMTDADWIRQTRWRATEGFMSPVSLPIPPTHVTKHPRNNATKHTQTVSLASKPTSGPLAQQCTIY